MGENFLCSQNKRLFFRSHLGKGFGFTVPFQKWIKEHPESTYEDAVNVYPKLGKDSDTDGRFEYNGYVRDFFENNRDKTLDYAIKCGKHKKSRSGNHRYSGEDSECLYKLNFFWY